MFYSSPESDHTHKEHDHLNCEQSATALRSRLGSWLIVDLIVVLFDAHDAAHSALFARLDRSLIAIMSIAYILDFKTYRDGSNFHLHFVSTPMKELSLGTFEVILVILFMDSESSASQTQQIEPLRSLLIAIRRQSRGQLSSVLKNMFYLLTQYSSVITRNN